ncbi:MAG TPA: TonB-dependent receptor [Rubricoccaceae bacterium]|nr:TonB-dependent receptor [Rubricoccaceae bacterium]
MSKSKIPRAGIPPAGRRLLPLAAVACLAMAAQAQQAAVNGFVRDAETGETLIQANVLVEGTGRGAATNTSGFYALADLAPGAYTLVFSYLGYETTREALTLAPGETRRLDVALRPASAEVGEVVVEAEEPLEEERAPGLQQVPIQLVERLPSVFEADLFRSIQLLPGVQASSDFSSKLYIRGGSPDQTLILLDGTTVYNPTHFFGFFSTFNTEAIKDVRLYKGAYPATYGGRLGSVIDIYNRDGNRNDYAGMLQLGLLASRAGVEGPVRLGGAEGSFMVAARRSTLEPLLAFLREELDEDAIPERFYFYDLNAKLGLDLSPRDRLSISGYAGRDYVRVPFAEDAEFELDYGNETLSLGYTRILSEAVFSSFRATASRYESRPVGRVSGTEFERPNSITDLSGRADVEWLPSAAFEGRAGVWGGHLDLRFRSVFDGEERVRFERPAPYASGYVEARWRPTPVWVLTTGLRADYFGAGGYLRLGPRLQVERLFGEAAVLQLAAGQYHQFLTLVSNEAFSGFDTWVLTEEGVAPAVSEQAALGLKTRLGAGLRFDVEVYGRTMRDLFEIRPEVQDVAGLEYAELFRIGEGYAYGVEVLLEKQAGPLTGLFGYTLSTTRRRYADAPGFDDWFPPKYDRLHDLNAVATYRLGRGWSITGALVYATGQAYTEPVGRYSVEGLDFISGDTNVLVTRRLNGQRLPPYHRLDFGFTKEGRFFGAGDYTLQLQAVNLYNRRNLWFYTYDFGENPVDREAVRQLPILPNVSLEVRF